MNPRTLHIVYNLIRGGTEGQCARVALGMAAAGLRHRVAVFRREGFFLDDVDRLCGGVYEIRIRHLWSPATALEILRLRRFIRREQFDLVHCWDADAAIFGSLAARLAGVPYITSRRDLGQIYPAHKLTLMRHADRHACAVVANADAIRDWLVESGVPARKIAKIPNLLDVEEFDQQAAQPFSKQDLLPEGRLIVMVARLDPEKDTKSLLRAFALVAGSEADAQLVVAGDGPEKPALEQLADEVGLRSRIRFLGDVTDVPALLDKASVGVLVPSANEGMSNSILEYMAAGLPVVATDCGGNRELLDDGRNGVVVKPGDVEGMAAALEQLLRNPDAAAEKGRAGRHRIEEAHQPEAVLQAFADLYAGAC